MKMKFLCLLFILSFSLTTHAMGQLKNEETPDNLKKIEEDLASKADDDEMMGDETEDDLDPDAADAVAVIAPTFNGPILGQAYFYQEEDGITVKTVVSNVPNPGKHGFHIHENGSCGDEGKAAGGHFNPHQADHGFYPEHGTSTAHLGDMGNIEIAEDGSGMLTIKLPGIFLKDEAHPVLGKAVILHEKEDDFSQPVGNAGGRIGCGIIVEQL